MTKHDSLTTRIDSRLYWIGFPEILPIVIGAIATDNIKPFLFLFDFLLIGIILSIIVAYIFKDDVPDPPINLKEG